jgi:hypothetical protein
LSGSNQQIGTQPAIKEEIPVEVKINEPQKDSVAAAPALEKKTKEKVKFKDKYKKEYQDSTRKIFVPGK